MPDTERTLKHHLLHLESMAFEYTTLNPDWHHQQLLPFGKQSLRHKQESARYNKARDDVVGKIVECFNFTTSPYTKGT